MGLQRSLTWFITGCSTGFGREVARAVVSRGYRAVVTARDPRQVEDLVVGHEDRTLALRLDVTDPAQVAEAVRRAEEHFGVVKVDKARALLAAPRRCGAPRNTSAASTCW